MKIAACYPQLSTTRKPDNVYEMNVSKEWKTDIIGQWFLREGENEVNLKILCLLAGDRVQDQKQWGRKQNEAEVLTELKRSGLEFDCLSQIV